MAMPEQKATTRPAEVNPHPTPVSRYFALLIMAAIAMGMVALRLA